MDSRRVRLGIPCEPADCCASVPLFFTCAPRLLSLCSAMALIREYELLFEHLKLNFGLKFC